jgi:multiple sugar transport system substrate-binding protein
MSHFKKMFLLTIFVLFVFLLTGCTAASPDAATGGEAAGDEPVTLSLWSRSATEGVVTALVDRWNETHENQVEVTIIPSDQFVTKFSTAIAGNQAPDLAVIDLIYTPAYMQADQLTNISDLAMGLPFFEDLSPAHVRLGTWEDGNIYAVPFAAEGSFLLYNKDLFEQAGLDPESPPTTWNEIYEAATAINALGDDIYGFYFAGACAGCNAFTFAPLIWASDGDVLSEDYSTPTLETDEVKAALNFYRQMWEDGLIPEGAEIDNGADFFNAFTSGKIGMAGSGAFGINGLKNDFPDINFGVAFLPGEEGGRSSFAGGDNIAIPKGSEHVDEAFEFLEWMYSEEVQLEQYAANSQLPVRTDLADNVYFAEDPRLTTATEAMGIGKAPYSVKYNDLFNDANGPWLAMIQKAIFEGDVDGAVAEAQERFSQIMGE